MKLNFEGKKIAIVGVGVEGESSVDFFKKQKAIVSSLDIKQGKDYLADLGSYDLAIRSPGVKPRDLEKYLTPAKITSQTKLFFDLCPCPIIGVTGTKGKGTTATLIYEMLKTQGVDVYLGGNIGNPPLDFLNKLTSKSWVVLELSSFQLIDLTKSPHIAVMLMTTSEHLDYHKDVKEYIQAKRNILKFQTPQDYSIISKDYPTSNESDLYTEGKVFKISREKEVAEGVFVKDNSVWFKKDGEILKVIDSSEILLPGKHNLENVGTAVMASIAAGVSLKNIIKVLREFKGLEHRLELVGEVNGVKYYDDSFSTTPETAIAAINAFKNPEILILGGSSKGSDFKELGHVIRDSKNIKAIIGIGVEWTRIKSQIQNPKFQIVENCKNMKEIVERAQDIAEPGDVVLLSPACASFGMFKNYKDRGEQFKMQVAALK